MNNSLTQLNVDNILWLRILARPFPATAGLVLNTAKAWSFSSSTISLLEQFPKDEVFDSEDDFVTRCEELEFMMREEKDMPVEHLLSPQD